MPSYHPAEIERRWQQYWESNKTFRTPDPGEPSVTGKPKYYVLDMFPYPSGAGLHVGHPEGYTATDILCRFKRMNGFHVLHPMGWDAYGLPAEQYAIETGTHPRITTQRNIDTFRRQIKSLGFSYDWDREVDTTDPAYFRWTQWIFLLIYDTWYDPQLNKGRPIAELPIPESIRVQGPTAIRRYQDQHRLAYQAEVPVNWCPALGTVLANEEVMDGKSERGGHPVERRPLRQWLMRITAYAERLLDDLESLDWSESIKNMQRNWIGKSEGAEIDFRVDNTSSHQADPLSIRVYTTRPDTLFGATYMVLSPEHPLVERVTTSEQRAAVTAYQQAAARKSEFERTELVKTKTGVFTGGYAINPATQQPIPIWIADYVLASYGTGAIMAVPAHDERDFEFAKQFKLPCISVVEPSDDPIKVKLSSSTELMAADINDGIASNSQTPDGSFSINGLATAEAKRAMIQWLEQHGFGRRRVNYKLRDWLFSRQRYWGEPFPILHGVDGETVPLKASDLPVLPPDLDDYKPTGSPEGPLAKANDWLDVNYEGKPYRRETNTMPQWAGSCWYYLRYIDPMNTDRFADRDKLNYWLPVDLYVGGAEHAVLHLLYSRFWHKVLYDRGYVPTSEPFQRLVNQGMILGENGEKMSKSRGNVINPDDVIRDYGADSMRLYEMFMGPLEATKPWQMNGVSGVYKFLTRAWRLIIDEQAETLSLHQGVQDIEPNRETLRILHTTIQRVTEDTEGLRFNTAISAMMELVNYLTKLDVRPRKVLTTFVLLLSPYAPHLAEELWRALGNSASLAYEPWPQFNPAFTVADEIEIPVQINGKLKTRLKVPSDINDQELESAALCDDTVKSAIAGKTIKLIKVITRKIVSIVTHS